MFDLDPPKAEISDIVFGGTVPSTNINLVDKTRENVGYKRTTGWIQLSSLEDSVMLRRLRVLFSGYDDLQVRIYVDGNEDVVSWSNSFSSNVTQTAGNTFYGVLDSMMPEADFVRVGLRAKFIKIELYTNATVYPFEIKQIQLEVD